MATALVDSNVLIAARLSRDQNHDSARDIVRAMDEGELPVGRVTSGALAEVLNYLQTRSDHAAAVETLDALVESVGFDVDRTTKSDFDAARSLFRQYEGLSFTDATIVAYMRRVEIEYVYSFDDDFDGIDGVDRLNAATNPFA